MNTSIRLTSAAQYYQSMPHQMAAWNWLQEQLSADVITRFAELYRAGPPAKVEASPSPGVDWLNPCLKLVQEFEGCRLTAYPDPGTGGEPWTIGWGATTMATGQPVRPGDTITQATADALLVAHLQVAHRSMLVALPMAAAWSGNRQAALTSFAYNVGGGALQDSTLRQRLLRGDDPVVVIREELPRWDKGGSGVLPGLVRRRAAEVALFSGQAAPAGAVVLNVPYEYQNDNSSGTGYRECFSSSCAMIARFYGKVDSDNEYNKIRQRFGDSTDSGAQLRALGSLGLQASFRQNGSADVLEQLLRDGRPVPVGWLHHGPITAPTGGGHWSVVIGFDAAAFIHHDPNGEANLVGGGYSSINVNAGRAVRYSRQNWLRRWEIDGRGSGWFMDVRV